MFYLYIVSFLECGLKRVNAQTLAVGGSPVIAGEYPWLVAIYNGSDVHICGGSIISRLYVLSGIVIISFMSALYTTFNDICPISYVICKS